MLSYLMLSGVYYLEKIMSKSFYLSSYASVCLSSQFDHNLLNHGKQYINIILLN